MSHFSCSQKVIGNAPRDGQWENGFCGSHSDAILRSENAWMIFCLVAWWYTYPSEKYMSESQLGWWHSIPNWTNWWWHSIPNWMESHNPFMFQITNQYITNINQPIRGRIHGMITLWSTTEHLEISSQRHLTASPSPQVTLGLCQNSWK